MLLHIAPHYLFNNHLLSPYCVPGAAYIALEKYTKSLVLSAYMLEKKKDNRKKEKKKAAEFPAPLKHQGPYFPDIRTLAVLAIIVTTT